MKRQRARSSTILKDNGCRVTDFENKVYQVVRRIPKGQTRSYAWVARAIGNPGAARAVGNALNRNPFIGTVPCHRVIRSDGLLGGFAMGGAKKRRLLRREGVDPL